MSPIQSLSASSQTALQSSLGLLLQILNPVDTSTEKSEETPAQFAERLSDGVWFSAPHLELLSDVLMSAADNTGSRRSIVAMPPRHGKSELVSHWFPVWYLDRYPEREIILASYEASFAAEWGRKVRNSVNEFEDQLNVRLRSDSKAANRFNTDKGGGMRTAGVNGPVTGKGAHIFIIDDPFKNHEQAASQRYRDMVWNWFLSAAYTRLAPGGVVIIVNTRWHEDDLAGRVLQAGKDGVGDEYEEITFPALAEEHDVLGRKPGDPLWPARYSKSDLEGIKNTLGPYFWGALYQQRPAPLEGNLFKRADFQIIDEPPENLRWYRYWDLAVSTRESADFTASAAVAFDAEGNLYIRDMVRGKMEWPDAREKLIIPTMINERHGRFRTFKHGIEKAIHGYAATQEFSRDRRLFGIPIEGINVERDKIVRAMSWQSRAALKKVYLVRGHWIEEFLDEVVAFPNHTHDDQVDTVSGGVEMFILPTDKKRGVLSQGVAKGWSPKR